MVFEKVPVLGKIMKEQKLKANVFRVKQEFLRTLEIQDLRELCVSKGLSTKFVNQDNVSLGNTNVEQEFNFYELVDLIAKTINSREIIAFCNKKNINAIEFKNAIDYLTMVR